VKKKKRLLEKKKKKKKKKKTARRRPGPCEARFHRRCLAHALIHTHAGTEAWLG